MKNQNSGPAPIAAGIFVTLLCLALIGGTVYLGILYFPQKRAIPEDLPASLEEVKATCADGECVQGCLLHAADAVGYEKYPPVMDSDYESALVSYRVQGDQLLDPSFPKIPTKLIVYQRNSKAHHRIWDYFTGIVPLGRRPGLGEFVIYSGGESGAQFSPNPDGGWILRVNVLDATDPEFLTHALVHEFGHFLTLNPAQQAPAADTQACGQEPLYGCPAPDSYVNQFFLDFWRDLYPEWQSMKGATNYGSLLDHFYEKHHDQFVSQYAASQPLEDIAETWTTFVTQPKPTGDSIAARKIRFFYQFPELLETRYELINGICNYEP